MNVQGGSAEEKDEVKEACPIEKKGKGVEKYDTGSCQQQQSYRAPPYKVEL